MTTSTEEFERLASVPGAVIMQPTTLCQPLDCRYCYLPFRHEKHLMPVEVAQAVAQSVNEWAREDPRFEIVWHGGEPLSVGRLHLTKLMAPFGRVKHTVQTNAVLIDDAWCEFFLQHDMGVGVSIDGPPDMNRSRVTRVGHPAHRVILRGIERLKAHSIPFSAIAVVTDPDPARAAEFYDFFADLGCHSLGVNVEEQEGANTTTRTPDPARATEFWAALTAAWRARPVIQLREVARVLDFARAVLQGQASGRPASAAWDPLPTIAYDGGVVLLSPELAGFTDPRFGDFTTGNVLHHSLAGLLSEAEQRTSWLPEFWRGVDACRRTCPYFAFCGGGHAANRYFEHAGRMDGTRTSYCTTAKIALLEGVTRHVRDDEPHTDHRPRHGR
ncbi:cyclophane-forming radical SAM peptide maturase AmcB [Streptomyces luteolus]|uniref:Radical SAM protein n=1 Tax=Streptomyces luteolus TaxID=3043615 RepID=A0ABT6SYE4_9ACTN|nr:cyclophane-forming radical SAM peptide maturase AmcB [Streptomyces sp. B-S-A12]MDI3420395.1 radical SAM protein [Streptomyces sp. B-S-A12]